MAKILVTAGSTREHLDDVRFLTNASSGRMGYAIAAAAARAGHDVDLVSGPTQLEPPHGVVFHAVESALQMQAQVEQLFEATDIVLGVAAVADYRPSRRLPGKLPRSQAPLTIELVPNPDILAALGRRKAARILVGFALEVPSPQGLQGALGRARRKLEQKNLDLIVVNLTQAMERTQSEVVLLWRDGAEERIPFQDKESTAVRIVQAALQLFAERKR